jgi:hypothetical protein
MLTAERPSSARWRRRGCSSRPTEATTRRSPPAPQSEGRSSSKLAGVDQATWARSTGAELDGDGGDWRRGWRNPTVRRKSATRRSRCAWGRRRISPEPGEELVGDSRIARGELGLGFDREGWEWGGDWAGPSRFDQTHLGGLTGGPRLSTQPFIFDLICFEPKTLKKNPNLFKNKSRKTPKIN